MGGVSMEWKEVRLGDVCEIKGGKRLPKGINLITQKNSHPYIRVRDLGKSKTLELNSSYEYVDEITQKQIQRYITLKGDILISIVGTIGLIAIVGGSLNGANLTENCVKLVKLDNIDSEYLYYYLKSPLGQQNISRGTVGAVQAKLPIKNIQEFNINCPVLISDQRRIASILSSLDRKIELNNKINADLEEMAQAIFKNWFVDFEPFKDCKFVDSELGMIPEGWKVGTLEDIAEITMGQSPAGNGLNENGEGMIFYQGSSDFGFRFPSIRVFTTEPKRLAVANSVLFSVRAPVGDINVAKEECCIGRGVASIKSKYGHDSYLFYAMKSLHKLFDSFDGEGTVFGSINKKTLSAIQILLPSDGIVEQFNNVASSFDDRIRSLSDENSRLSLLRDTLLPRLMSGELEVPE